MGEIDDFNQPVNLPEPLTRVLLDLLGESQVALLHSLGNYLFLWKTDCLLQWFKVGNYESQLNRATGRAVNPVYSILI